MIVHAHMFDDTMIIEECIIYKTDEFLYVYGMNDLNRIISVMYFTRSYSLMPPSCRMEVAQG